MRFEPLGGALERGRAFASRRLRPGRKARCGRRYGCRRSRRIGFTQLADRAAVNGREHWTLDTGAGDAVDKRRGRHRDRGAGAHLGEERVEARSFAKLDTGRVAPIRRIEIARQRNMRIARVARADDAALRPAQYLLDRHARIGGDRNEGRVGAVFQEPPHQIGQQIAVAADRRIDAAGDVGQFGEQRLVERFAHAMQALEFKALYATRVFDHAGDSQRIVGGELRKQARRARQADVARRPCSKDRS